MSIDERIRVHWFDGQRMIHTSTVIQVPAVGDEVRMFGDIFFRVVRRVWPLDEPHYRYRCNVEMEEIKNDNN